MSSYAAVYLSDGRPVCAFRNGVDDLFFVLFTRRDWIEIDGAEAWRLVKEFGGVAEEEAYVAGFRATVAALRDRLDLLGVTPSAVSARLSEIAAERVEIHEGLRNLSEEQGRGAEDEFSLKRRKEDEYLKSLSWESWLDQMRQGIQAGLPVRRWGYREPIGSPSYLMALWDEDDPRYALRAVLEALPAEEEITLDLADLLDGGWLDPSIDPRDRANALVSYTSQGGLLPIVLTEGRFDAEVLSTALRLRRPHLDEYIKFPDFSQRNEGGAAALRQTVRAFASAGVPNRILAVFDNDTAARDVLRSLRTQDLPANIRVTCLPRLALAENYPTVGPQGEHTMDVNGLATSIELYLGSDVLADGDQLRPVLWGGYVRAMNAYQGEVSDKETIHARFREKVEVATRASDSMATQDWTGMDLVLDHLIGSIRDAVLPE